MLIIEFCHILILSLNAFAEAFPATQDDDKIDLSFYGKRIYGNPDHEFGKILNSLEGNPEEQGPYLEGDMLVTKKQLDRNGMKSEATRWKNGVIPYEIRDTRERELIERAFGEYKRTTCIRFVPRKSSESDYISIENDSSGCWSHVGRTSGMQAVNLQSPGCVTKFGTILHELLHTVGFLHEQTREDRDKYVRINLKNVRPGYEINFDKAKSGTTTTSGVSYDYGSVMHYSSHAFSGNGMPTIEAKSKTNDKMGQRDGFSKKDIDKINKMYKCSKNLEEPNPSTGGETNASFLENLIGAFFPGMDEEEMVTDKIN